MSQRRISPSDINKALAKIYGEGSVVMYRDPHDYYYFVVSEKYVCGCIPSMFTYNLEGYTVDRILEYVKDYLIKEEEKQWFPTTLGK